VTTLSTPPSPSPSPSPSPLTSLAPRPPAHVARLILGSFLITFLASRILVLLIMTRRIHDMYFYMGQTHVHHLNYGIFLLTLTGAYLLFFPRTPAPVWVTLLYGVGLGLTFDEFGMWLHLGGPYWQRASFDAVIIITAALGLIATAPAIWRFRPRHWITAGLSVLLIGVFVGLLHDGWSDFANKEIPRLDAIQREGPQ
jgi:hypothetical protein